MNVKIDIDKWKIEPQKYRFMGYVNDEEIPLPRVNVLLPGTKPKSKEMEVDTIWLIDGKLYGMAGVERDENGYYKGLFNGAAVHDLLYLMPGYYSDDPTIDRLIKEAKHENNS